MGIDRIYENIVSLLKKISAVLFILIIVLLLIGVRDFYQHVNVSTEEQIRDDEEKQAKAAAERFIQIVEKNKKGGHIGRGAHAKGHACVKAYFDIEEDVDAKFRHGIFSEPGKQFKSWIRFSNANSVFANKHDKEKDAHGMAIKLLNVAQTTLQGDNFQDFLMADNPAFFSPDVESYNQFLNSKNSFTFFFPSLNPLSWRIREFTVALATLKEPPATPVRMSYFSNTAYKLGPQNIKFSAQPCELTNTKQVSEQINNKDDQDFLKKNMKAELSGNSACFQFMVQLQNPEKKMPVEDPSIVWREKDSPFISVAKIRIPEQTFDSEKQMEFCENLSFSPWNALPEHQPLGQLNRIRKHVYASSSDYRHKQNNQSIPADLDW